MSDDDQQEQDPNSPGRLRQMYEDSAREAAEAKRQLADFQKREVFHDAGLDLSKPLHQALAKAYDGALDTEQVNEYVRGLGVVDASAPPSNPATDAEREANERIARAAAGSENPPQSPTGHEAFERDIRELMSTSLGRNGRALRTNQDFDNEFMRIAQKHGVGTTWDNGRDQAPR